MPIVLDGAHFSSSAVAKSGVMHDSHIHLAVLALIGAVISECIASAKGLGFVIKTQVGELDISVMFAAIINLAVIGALAGAVVRFVQRRVFFWVDPAR